MKAVLVGMDDPVYTAIVEQVHAEMLAAGIAPTKMDVLCNHSTSHTSRVLRHSQSLEVGYLERMLEQLDVTMLELLELAASNFLEGDREA